MKKLRTSELHTQGKCYMEDNNYEKNYCNMFGHSFFKRILVNFKFQRISYVTFLLNIIHFSKSEATYSCKEELKKINIHVWKYA